MTTQAATLGHVSNFFTSAPQIALAETPARLAGAPAGSRVFFCNSGTEAIEAAVKLTRRTGRTGIVAAEGAFHGRTTGALALTHKPAYREPFEPLMPGDVTYVPYGDADGLRGRGRRARPAAVVLEPVQGEAGVRPRRRRHTCRPPARRRRGAAPCSSSTRCRPAWAAPAPGSPTSTGGVVPRRRDPRQGPGRRGPDRRAADLRPQVTALLAARAARHDLRRATRSRRAAGLATLGVIEREGLLRAGRVGRRAASGSGSLALGHPLVTGVRGEGCCWRSSSPTRSRPWSWRCALDAGFIVNAVTPDALRLAPPLVIEEHELATFVAALPGPLDGAGG